MVTRGDMRSASAPPTNISTPRGTAWATSTEPSARLEPVSWRTSHAIAMWLKKSPNSESDVPTQSLRNGPDENTVHGRGGGAATAVGTGTSSSITPPRSLFREDLDFDSLLRLVDIDRELAEVVDDLVQVLRLDLRDVDVDAVLVQLFVHAPLSTGWDEAGEPHAGAQQHDRHAHVDVHRPFVLLVGVHHHPQVFGRGLLLGGGGGSGRLFALKGAQQAIGLVRVDLSGCEHLEDLPAFFSHFSFSSSSMA